MSAGGEASPGRLLRWLVGPSERITNEEERAGARLLAVLTLVHLPAAIVGSTIGTAFRWHMTSAMLLRGSLRYVLLASSLMVLASYALVRSGRYRPAVGAYLLGTICLPLLAPFVGDPLHEVGLLALAFVPALVAATLLPVRWFIAVAVGVVAATGVELALVSWPAREVVLGFTILLVVFGSSVLLLVMRQHQGRLEALRAERLRRSEAGLRTSHDRVSALLSASRDLVAVVDASGARRALFGGVEQVTGREPEKRGPLSHLETIHPEDRERVRREFVDLIEHPGRVVRTEWRYLHQDGKYRWHEGLLTNRLGQEGIDGIVVNIRDITDRRAAEEAVVRSERRYRTLFETVTDGIFLLARDGRLIEVNDAACRMLGYTRDELLGMRMDDVVPEERREHLAEINRTVAEKGRFVFEAVMRRKSGVAFPVEVVASLSELDGAPVFMGVSRDITDRVRAETEKQRLQDQLQHAVKMESIGRLAGGVAHDFNNLLTAILGNTDLALFQVERGADPQAALSEIRESALSAAAVTRQLLAFSRRHVVETRPLDVNDLIQRLHKMLERVIGEDVRLSIVSGQGLGLIEADPGLIEQAVINLVVNARDAMPRGGNLAIETAAMILEEEPARSRGLVRGGRHVVLSITDTGHGMSGEVKRHLFEPFFTTKPRGQGTGLGLATTYAAVEQSGGGIEVFSEVGKGTTFKIYLPVASDAALGAPAPVAAEVAGMPGGKESVLVVEDDGRVRDLVTRSLRSLGYEVLVAATGEEALAVAVARTGRIDLLLTDVVLPGMNGREVAQALVKVHPETRTLFTSGYGESIIAHGGSLDAGIEFLGKPYAMEVLARRLREILDRP